MKKFAVILISLLIGTVSAGPALATSLVSSSPVAGSVLSIAPTAVTLIANADGTRTFTAGAQGSAQKASDLFQGNPSAAPFAVVAAKRAGMNPSSVQGSQNGGYKIVQ